MEPDLQRSLLCAKHLPSPPTLSCHSHSKEAKLRLGEIKQLAQAHIIDRWDLNLVLNNSKSMCSAQEQSDLSGGQRQWLEQKKRQGGGCGRSRSSEKGGDSPRDFVAVTGQAHVRHLLFPFLPCPSTPCSLVSVSTFCSY